MFDKNIIKDFERKLEIGLNIKELDNFYRKKLGCEKYIYNLPLSSKLDEAKTVQLAKKFFENLNLELLNKANRVIEGIDTKFKFIFEEPGKVKDENGNKLIDAGVRNFSIVYCPRKGDLRDLYSIVHEVTHTFDLGNGDTATRRVFGEVAPQCMERMLDEYLQDLNDEDIDKYGLNKSLLFQDIINRKISTFLSRKDNIKSFNRCNGNSELDLRYSLAQLYSSAFMKLDKAERVSKLIDFMKSIENNDINYCSKAFGIDFNDKFKMQHSMQNVVRDIKICQKGQLINSNSIYKNERFR